uniref:GPN-loop GTPase 3 n=1 Tax=Leishmania naiffi TaxID=5678 RepID=A0AAW3BQE1_9TRYP
MFSLSSMVCFDCPFINVLTKCDLLSKEFKENGVLEHFCMCDFDYMDLSRLPPRFRAMSRQVGALLTDFNLVTFRPVDIEEVGDVSNLCSVLDETLQVADEAEVQDHDLANN